jgi:hypothetical protein
MLWMLMACVTPNVLANISHHKPPLLSIWNLKRQKAVQITIWYSECSNHNTWKCLIWGYRYNKNGITCIFCHSVYRPNITLDDSNGFCRWCVTLVRNSRNRRWAKTKNPVILNKALSFSYRGTRRTMEIYMYLFYRSVYLIRLTVNWR